MNNPKIKRHYRTTNIANSDNNLPTGVRENLPQLRPEKRVLKISDFEKKFSIIYKKPHSIFITKDILKDLMNAELSILEEEVIINLRKYNKVFTFASKSDIMNKIYIEELYQKYDQNHTILKAPVKIKKKRTKASSPAKLDINNEKMSQAIENIDNGLSAKTAAKLFGLKYNQIKWCLQKRKIGQIPKLEKRGRKTKILKIYLDFLENHLTTPRNRFTSLYTLKTIILRRFNLSPTEISTNLIHKMIRKINFSYKKNRKIFEARNTAKTKQSRYDLIEEIIKHRMLNRKFIYIDETGFNNFIIPIFGYSPKGERLTYEVQPKTNNFSVLAAFSDEGILAYQIFEKGISGRDFGAFMANLILKTDMQNKGLNNFVFFMDNAKIHIAKSWKILREHIITCFNAPYSPFLNPIEELFALWKHHYRMRKIQNQKDVISNIISSSKEINERHALGFIKHSVKYYIDCLDLKDIN